MATRSAPVELDTRRAYEAAAKGDGRRILVDRLWPRGVSKDALAADAWVKAIAPSDGLRQWFGHDPARWEGFRERYFKEIDANPEGLEALLDELRDVKRATLLFAAADTRHNNATALLQYLVAAHHAHEAA